MASNVAETISKMIEFLSGDTKRISHFLKVYSFAKTIGELERLPERTQNILEMAAVLHDIGIKPALEKYGSSAGNYQQIEGPAPAEKMLRGLGQDEEMIQRVCWLIAHHHTYKNVSEIDHRILIEADFLVNIDEGGLGKKQIESIRSKCFETQTGLRFLGQLFCNIA